MRTLFSMALILTLACGLSAAGEMQLTDPGADCHSPAWCSSGYITFASDRSGSYDIWVMYEGGESVDSWRATQTPANIDLDPAWNAACTHLHFSASMGGGSYYLYYVSDNGPPPDTTILLSLELGNNYAPHATADGVVFYADRAGNNDVMWKPTGSEVSSTYLTTNPADDRDPCLSPDNSLVTFASDRSGNWDIWVMDASGESGGVWQLTHGEEDETHPVFSPDGQKVLFHRDGVGLAVVELATRSVHQVTSDPSDTEPCWKPDGTMIAFVRNTMGEDQIWSTDSIPETAVDGSEMSWGVLKALYR
jgi:Tol biopolymer transport system component